MKSTSAIGKAIISRFAALKVGQPCVFPTPVPGLSQEATQAILRETTWDAAVQKGYWIFTLYWHGCHIGDVTAEVVETELTMEVL